MRSERGQTSTEYVGLLLLAVAVVGAILATNLGSKIADGVSDAVCSIVSGDCESSPGDGGTGSTEDALEARENQLDGLAEQGDNYADLLDQARAARERGDLEEADRILDQLELYENLSAGDRGDLIDMAGLTDAEFADLVDQETIDGDGENMRYFTVPPSPGDGVIVMDYFIPTENSGPLKGDDRDTQDPLLGEAGLDESRIVVVIDRETGRGVIHQSQTCSASYLPSYCEDPLPIELGDTDTQPQGIPGIPGGNEFDIEAGDGYIDLNYDALNSVTPVGISVDGQVRFERGEDGTYENVEDSRDPYPRIVTGQYRPGEDNDEPIIDETEDEPVFPGALPGPVRDAIDGAGEVRDFACDIPVGPFGGIGRELVC